MTITFEHPTGADLPSLLIVQIRSFDSDYELYPDDAEGGPPGYDSIDQLVKDVTECIVYKIVNGRKIVGGIVIADRGEGHYHLDKLFIDPDYHNQGIGSAAMRFLEETFPDAVKWTLDTPLYADRNQHFYEKFGFVKVGQRAEGDTNFMLIEYEKRQAADSG